MMTAHAFHTRAGAAARASYQAAISAAYYGPVTFSHEAIHIGGSNIHYSAHALPVDEFVTGPIAWTCTTDASGANPIPTNVN